MKARKTVSTTALLTAGMMVVAPVLANAEPAVEGAQSHSCS